jgi:uncharacterized protein YlxW (UPF0749 family)
LCHTISCYYNGDATDQQIAAEKAKVEEKYNSLKQAIAGLTPDLAPLQTAKTQLQNDIESGCDASTRSIS